MESVLTLIHFAATLKDMKIYKNYYEQLELLYN